VSENNTRRETNPKGNAQMIKPIVTLAVLATLVVSAGAANAGPSQNDFARNFFAERMLNGS
jgi:hypothetical protein